MLLYPLAYPLDFFWVIVGEHPDYSSPSPQSFAALVLPPEATHFAGCHRGIQPLLCPSKFQCSNEHWEPNLFSLHLEPCGGIHPWNSSCKLQLKLQKSKLFFTTCCLMIWSGLYYDYHYPRTGNPVLIQPRFQKKLFPLSEPVQTPPARFPPAESQVLGLVSWFSWLGNLAPNGGLTIWEQC